MEETEGISFTEICKIILRKIWIIVAISIGLGVVLAGAFWIKNKADAKYEFSFVLDFPGYEEGIYPDASAFNYKDIISEDSINNLAEKQEYKTVNFDKIIDDISISKITNKITEGSTPKYEDVYTIKINKTAIKDKKLAKTFLTDLANSPIEYAKNSINNYDYFQTLNLYEEVTSYDFKIAYLTEERQYLIDSYSALIEEYGEQVVDSNNKTIAYYKNQVNSKAFSQEITNLTNELNVKGYYYLADLSTDTAQIEINKLLISIDKSLENIKYYDLEIKDLKENIKDVTSNSDVNQTQTRITTLTTYKNNENKNIDLNLKYISYIVAKTGATAPTFTGDLQTKYDAISLSYVEAAETNFNNNLDKVKDKLVGYANTYREVMKDFINSNSYIQVNSINEIGGTSPVLGAVIGIIVGFIISSIVVYFVESAKDKKAKEENM